MENKIDVKALLIKSLKLHGLNGTVIPVKNGNAEIKYYTVLIKNTVYNVNIKNDMARNITGITLVDICDNRNKIVLLS